MATEQAWQEGGMEAGGGPPSDPETDSPLFKTDEFRLWCMKVIPCTKRFVHDWTICPFAHAGEKAVRRDPRLHSYTGIACPDMKKTGACIRGEKCPYAHNVFEYWLHPTRYRTQLCNDGPMCRRGICFFAHSLDELRVPACKPYVSPEALARASLEAISQNPHPLGQQLPNPVAAQQQAAMAAMGGHRGGGGNGGGMMRHGSGGGRDSAPSSLAAAASPFVPHGFHPSGEPTRYSAPGGGRVLSHSGSGNDFSSMGGGGGEYAHLPPHYQQQMREQHQRWTPHPTPQQLQANQQQQAQQQQHYQQHQFGSMPSNGGNGTMRLSNNNSGNNNGQRFSGGSAPTGSGMDQAGGSMRQGQQGQYQGQQGQYQQQGQQQGQGQYQGSGGGSGSYSNGPTRVASPSPRRSFGSGNMGFANAQQAPSQGFTSSGSGGYPAADQHTGGGGGNGGGGNGGGVQSTRSSGSYSDDIRSGAASPRNLSRAPSNNNGGGGAQNSNNGGGGAQNSNNGGGGSGRASPDHDLAQSLASLKIAMTQQQLAAAAGSNHEVVITTLHQILKDAMAQQGSGSMSASASFGVGPNGEPAGGSSAAVVAAAIAAQQQLASQMGGNGSGRNSGNADGGNGGGGGGGGGGGNAPCWGAPQHNAFSGSPSGHSFGAGGPSVSSSLAGSVPQFQRMSPQSSTLISSLAEAATGAAATKAGPALSSSPDAIACYEAALLAAAGGYPGLMPMGGGQRRSMSPRTSGDSSTGGQPREELSEGALPANEAGEAGGM